MLTFADKERRMVSALVQGLCCEIRVSEASKTAERQNKMFQEVLSFLRQDVILAGDATTGESEHSMMGREKISGQQKKKKHENVPTPYDTTPYGP